MHQHRSLVQTGQSGRGPRLIKHETRDPVLLVSDKVDAHKRDSETETDRHRQLR
jgi:hypothetical protein